jgi:hypothetical protein
MEYGIFCYFGRLGSGKTYAMVRDILDFLEKGHVVYTNIKIDWDGYEEKVTPLRKFLYRIGKKKYFVRYPKSNLRYIATDEQFHERFEKLKDCIVALDEAYVLFDSYQMTKMPLRQRMAILHTRKARRSILYTSQRITSVHKELRNMTNVFYQCDKVKLPFIGWRFRRVEHELVDVNNGQLDENVLSVKSYNAKQKYFDMYDTKEFVGYQPEFEEDTEPRFEYFVPQILEKKEKTNKLGIKAKLGGNIKEKS